MKGFGLAVTLLVMISTGLFSSIAESAYFTGIGDLNGGTFDSYASGISADGNVVVGMSSSYNNIQAFRWTKETGIIQIANGYQRSSANSVNADGSVIAGYIIRQDNLSEAFRWTTETGIVGLGNLYGGNYNSAADAINADGSVLAGYSGTPIDGEAFRWTQDGGMVGLGHLPDGDLFSAANAINADGTIIVGHSKSPPNSEPFLWSNESGMVGLGYLANDSFGAAYGISSDGLVVVGYGSNEAFRWSAETGMVGLGDLPGGIFASQAFDASANGSIVVGESSTGITGSCTTEAFIWDAENGIRRLENVLNAEGLNLTGWILCTARGISDDGKTIAGTGINPEGFREAWIANIDPTPPNEPPQSICGTDRIVFDSVSPDASASYDPDGSIVDYYWKVAHKSDPNNYIEVSGINPTISGLTKDFYNMCLTVTDDLGATDTDCCLLAAAGSCSSCTPTSIHVESITLTTVKGSKGQSFGQATVIVNDDCGNPVSGVTVVGHFDGDFKDEVSGDTEADGSVMFTTLTEVRKPSFNFIVDQLSGGPY